MKTTVAFLGYEVIRSGAPLEELREAYFCPIVGVLGVIVSPSYDGIIRPTPGSRADVVNGAHAPVRSLFLVPGLGLNVFQSVNTVLERTAPSSTALDTVSYLPIRPW